MSDKEASTTLDLGRRRFALTSMASMASTALGTGMLMSKAAFAADAPNAPSPNQTSGPVQQDGLSPRLTMHGLDTWNGTPAAGMRVDLFAIEGDRSRLLQTTTLAASGRSEPPLLIGDMYRVGTYELLLHVDEYFASRKVNLPQPLFLSKIPLRFRITDAGQRIHLPVLFGPWSYNYYRGS